MKKLYPNFTFEIVNFDTKGDKILNVALPKIGDKGLFTKELEDALENNTIDFVVHSLKDMPCQEMPKNLIICGIPEREDPRDALVMAKRWQSTKFCLDDLDDNSVIGTSSLRRISQLKEKYPTFKFETIRGNLQTRFSKLDDEIENKFDAIILAAAGLKRLNYDDRITQYLPPEICMHAVSQGALGIECRKNDIELIKMINKLNDEETLLKCIAERTFLAKLEGGCSAPVGVFSKIDQKSILLEGVVMDLDGTKRIQDKFEMRFDTLLDECCPVISIMKNNQILSIESNDNINQTNKDFKRVHSRDEDDQNPEELKVKRSKSNQEQNTSIKIEENLRQYSFIVDLSIDEKKMIKAELCGLHLAERLKEKGADILINEIKNKVQKENF
jgi:hydroxymethylbilane synthase